MLSIYFGIYHAFIVKELFEGNESKKLYLQLSSAFYGFHLAMFEVLEISNSDVLFKIIQGFQVGVCLLATLGFIVINTKLDNLSSSVQTL